MTVRLWWTTVYLTDMGRAVRFYRDLVGLPVRFVEREYASFNPNGGMLEVEKVEPGSPLVGRTTGIGLGVEDLDETYAELRAAGVEFRSPPEKQPWGDYLAIVADPDGNLLALDQLPADWDAYARGSPGTT